MLSNDQVLIAHSLFMRIGKFNLKLKLNKFVKKINEMVDRRHS